MPAPARQTPPINPENYTLRFPQDKKWVVQNSCPKVGLSFFGKKGQHFCDSIRSGLRACINDVRKIKIGKNQNQNWVLIGRGSKPPDYASLFFGNRCQTKEVPRDLMFIFRKINIGGVHLIEGFPNATRQRPEHSRVTTAARRQTAPPHNTHNFCWHGPRQRSHGEGNR